MHIEAQVIRELIKAGLSGDDLLSAIDRIESAESLRKSAETPKIDEQAERRRAADRERKKAERTKLSAEPSAERDIDSNTTLSEENNNNIPLRRKSADKGYPPEFEEVWACFSRKVGKDDAFRAWVKVRSRVSHETLIAAIKAQAKLDVGKEKRFIPHPATWLNDGRWLDEDLQPPKPQEPVSNGKVWVPSGTDPYDAWAADYRKRGKVPPGAATGGYWFPSQWPPDHVSHETMESAA